MADESRELIRRLAAGDRDALEALIERHLPGLRAFVRLHAGAELRARESTSDLCQSACREVLAHADRFRYAGEDAFRHWLYTTAMRKIRNRQRYWLAARRDAQRDVPLVAPSSPDRSAAALLECYASICTPSKDAIAREAIERIETAFEELTSEQREVVLLARVVGLSHREIAARTGRSEGAVRTFLFRALARLADAMGAR